MSVESYRAGLLAERASYEARREQAHDDSEAVSRLEARIAAVDAELARLDGKTVEQPAAGKAAKLETTATRTGRPRGRGGV